MGHYRVYKLDEDSRRIVKAKDIEAGDDEQAMQAAKHDPDCPVCEVWTGARDVGSIEHED